MPLKKYAAIRIQKRTSRTDEQGRLAYEGDLCKCCMFSVAQEQTDRWGNSCFYTYSKNNKIKWIRTGWFMLSRNDAVKQHWFYLKCGSKNNRIIFINISGSIWPEFTVWIITLLMVFTVPNGHMDKCPTLTSLSPPLWDYEEANRDVKCNNSGSMNKPQAAISLSNKETMW